LLRVLVWNGQLRNESAYPAYREPFDLMAEGLKTGIWSPLVDWFRTSIPYAQLPNWMVRESSRPAARLEEP
jgi:hypothetical protein